MDIKHSFFKLIVRMIGLRKEEKAMVLCDNPNSLISYIIQYPAFTKL